MPISVPAQITVPFATSGLKNAIPANANNTTGNAGFDLGFPSINRRQQLVAASRHLARISMGFFST